MQEIVGSKDSVSAIGGRDAWSQPQQVYVSPQLGDYKFLPEVVKILMIFLVATNVFTAIAASWVTHKVTSASDIKAAHSAVMTLENGDPPALLP